MRKAAARCARRRWVLAHRRMERALVLGECMLSPAVPDGSVVRVHARAVEGGASAHTPPGVDEGGKTPPRPGVRIMIFQEGMSWTPLLGTKKIVKEQLMQLEPKVQMHWDFVT